MSNTPSQQEMVCEPGSYGLERDNEMRFRGFIAKVNFNGEFRIFEGEVEGMKEPLTFRAKSVDELREAFITVVNEYLAKCTGTNRVPHKSYRGSFNVRLSIGSHHELVEEAKRRRISLNEAVKRSVDYALEHPEVLNIKRVAW